MTPKTKELIAKPRTNVDWDDLREKVIARRSEALRFLAATDGPEYREAIKKERFPQAKHFDAISCLLVATFAGSGACVMIRTGDYLWSVPFIGLALFCVGMTINTLRKS